MAVRSFTFAFLALFLAFPVFAQDFSEGSVFPLACQPGINCFILSYPDLDRAEGVARDYTCGPSAEDGDGTLRIGVGSIEDLRKGIDVMAVREGKVIDARDGTEDRIVSSRREIPRGTPLCGNGVVIDHGGGTQTAYCHLRKGSIRVTTGQHVNAGDVIGQVGQSGAAFWPQLGFSIQTSGLFADPVSSMTMLEGCGWKPRPMVAMAPFFEKYQPASMVAIGFSLAPITDQAMVLGRAPSLLRMARLEPSITLYGMILGVRKGDKIEARIRDPRGRTVTFQEMTTEQDEQRLRVNLIATRGYAGWMQGEYTGDIRLTRMVKLKPTMIAKQVTMTVR